MQRTDLLESFCGNFANWAQVRRFGGVRVVTREILRRAKARSVRMTII